MLLRIVPFLAVLLTLIAIVSTGGWLPHDKTGLWGPGHVTGVTS